MDLNFVEELLNFSSDIDEEEVSPKQALASSLGPNGLLLGPPDSVRPWNSHEAVEEELEWISNKDAFPSVESFMGLLPGDHRPLSAVFAVTANDRSPVSVLDDATTVTTTTTSTSGSLTSCFGGLPAPPRRSRTKRRPRAAAADLGWGAASATTMKKKKKSASASVSALEVVVVVVGAIGGRKCQHCGADKTPQWRAGPGGPKTLCNACGVRYKSGRLVPEYRPASSPTFSAKRHSNSHRRIMEMRRVKGLVVKQPLESG